MSIIAEYRFRSPKLGLRETQSAVEGLTFELVREVGTDPQQPYLFLQAYSDDFEALERAMGDDETVASFERYVTFETSVLYRVQISAATDLVVYPVWVEVGARALKARWEDGWWRNRAMFPDRAALATVRDWCHDNGVEFVLGAVYTEDGRSATSVLTPAQRELLEETIDQGYFAVPRESSLADVADALGISSQAASERLRRAHDTLVEHHLLPGDACQ